MKFIITFLILISFINSALAEDLPFGDKPFDLKIKIEAALENYKPKPGQKIIAKGYFPGGLWDYFIIFKKGKKYFVHNYLFDKKSNDDEPVENELKKQGTKTYWIIDQKQDRYIIDGASVEIWDQGGLIEKARVFNPY